MTAKEPNRWTERSRAWAKSAPQGVSQDDSFNQMIIAEAGIRPGEAVLDIATGAADTFHIFLCRAQAYLILFFAKPRHQLSDIFLGSQNVTFGAALTLFFFNKNYAPLLAMPHPPQHAGALWHV